MIRRSGLIEHYQKDKADRGEARVENLLELVSAARGFHRRGEADLSPLESFLAHAVLESGEGQGEAFEDCVQMMTLHTAKGLEFPLVFLAGLEDGLFPHQRSINDLDGLEEERRLCYVGMTRAMRQLYFTYAEQRRLLRGGQLQPAVAFHSRAAAGADRGDAAAYCACARHHRRRRGRQRPRIESRAAMEALRRHADGKPCTPSKIRRRRGAQRSKATGRMHACR